MKPKSVGPRVKVPLGIRYPHMALVPVANLMMVQVAGTWRLQGKYQRKKVDCLPSRRQRTTMRKAGRVQKAEQFVGGEETEQGTFHEEVPSAHETM